MVSAMVAAASAVVRSPRSMAELICLNTGTPDTTIPNNAIAAVRFPT